MSIRDIIANINPPIELAQRLGPQGIRNMLEIMWIAYHDLIEENIVNNGFDENAITQEWFLRIQAKWDSGGLAIRLCPMPQYEDSTLAKKRGQKPTIDFCFRTWNIRDEYFGAECKILKAGEQKKIDRYINTGINNFTIGRYGSKCSTSAMVGYVLQGPIGSVISELKQSVELLSPIENLSRDMTWDDPHYHSTHLRTFDDKHILLHHMFFLFE